jgi:fructose-bisphosphate aldolase class I
MFYKWNACRALGFGGDAGLVPVVEPEILMDGDHTIDRTAEVQEQVLTAVYQALRHCGVLLEGTLLKPSMTCPGKSCAQQVRTSHRSLPS